MSGLGCAWAVPLCECPPSALPPPPLFRYVRQPNHSRGLSTTLKIGERHGHYFEAAQHTGIGTPLAIYGL